MKRLLFFVLCVMLAVVYGYGQMNTGSFFAAGTAGLDLEIYGGKDIDSDDKTNYLDLSFNPKMGYFIKNRIAVGGAVYF